MLSYGRSKEEHGIRETVSYTRTRFLIHLSGQNLEFGTTLLASGCPDVEMHVTDFSSKYTYLYFLERRARGSRKWKFVGTLRRT